MASREADKNDKYLEGIMKDIHLHVDLVNVAVHGLQSNPHWPGKTRQQDGEEHRGNDIFERLAD
jgi:hypothetical protein